MQTHVDHALHAVFAQELEKPLADFCVKPICTAASRAGHTNVMHPGLVGEASTTVDNTNVPAPMARA